jgi:hypothetical protein
MAIPRGTSHVTSLPARCGRQVTHDYQVGPQFDGSDVVPTDQIVIPAGAQVNFAGRPLAIAIRPHQHTAAVLNTKSGESNFPTSPITIVELDSGAVKQQFTPLNGKDQEIPGKRVHGT